MKKLIQLLPILLVLSIQSCQKDSTEKADQNLQPENSRYTAPLNTGELTSRSGCDWTEIPAGSVDALADAIASTCDNGVIYLRAGMHTENLRVTVSKSVKIIGEAGAVLKIKSDLAPYNTDGTENIFPGLHILNAPGTLVQDLEIQPVDGDGGTAILIEKSDASAVMRCKISNFQFSIMIEKSDRITAMFNNIVATGLWQTGVVNEALGIVVINGKSNYISDNEVSNAFFGVWACGSWSTYERNSTHGNYIGLILCNVPLYMVLPSGDVTGAETPATGWKVSNNTSTDNFDNGIMVIDGSKFNKIWNNQVHGNGLSPLAGTAADIETFDDSYLFGFLTPSVQDNYIDATSDPATTTRNCGINNTFVGGTDIGGSCR
ncbi:MAG: right-handed parallel beta-helix repeat-containing protein [Lewinellaceae bacterium]|nr:right-handed parallel beta-helix repeat-containing protein [Saprospiraceae bacterium]MCB9339625.1 right-handed parallel beta-helix repeat-containing protein [Lewinellaceae bacterium]